MQTFSIVGTSPAAAAIVIDPTVIYGLARFSSIRVDALLLGATGGVLDVYLQRKLGPNAWADYCHFAQLAAGASAVRYSITGMQVNSTTIVTANGGTDAAPAVSLGAATFLGGHPGDALRVVYVAGASTSAGAAVAINVTGLGEKSA